MPEPEDTVAAGSRIAFLLIFLLLPVAVTLVDLYAIQFSLELLVVAMVWLGLGFVLLPLFFNADEE